MTAASDGGGHSGSWAAAPHTHFVGPMWPAWPRVNACRDEWLWRSRLQPGLGFRREEVSARGRHAGRRVVHGLLSREVTCHSATLTVTRMSRGPEGAGLATTCEPMSHRPLGAKRASGPQLDAG